MRQTGGNDERDRTEARRILERINAEMDSSGLATGGSAVERMRKHFAGGDADPEDRIEVVGRRIGRALSLALFIGLLVWLALFLVQHGSGMA